MRAWSGRFCPSVMCVVFKRDKCNKIICDCIPLLECALRRDIGDTSCNPQSFKDSLIQLCGIDGQILDITICLACITNLLSRRSKLPTRTVGLFLIS